MKKRCLCLLMLLFLACALPALGEEAKYSARANREFHLRQAPDDGARRLKNMQPKAALEVLEYGEEWSQVSLGGTVGYARNRWLSQLRSLDPQRFSVPGYERQTGIATVEKPAFITVEGYGGSRLMAQDSIAIKAWDGTRAVINIMRGESFLPAGAVRYEAFVPWEEAGPGDMIGGFTTYYNETTGGRLAANRRHNIELAAARINGAVLRQSEDFSFNARCGPYRKFNGYAMAPNISEEGKGYGGGVCQVSTTLYLAALGLPVRVVDWSLHRESGVDYAPQGFDAAVGSYSDLVIKSLLPYDIRLAVRAQTEALTVLIYRAEK